MERKRVVLVLFLVGTEFAIFWVLLHPSVPTKCTVR